MAPGEGQSRAAKKRAKKKNKKQTIDNVEPIKDEIQVESNGEEPILKKPKLSKEQIQVETIIPLKSEFHTISTSDLIVKNKIDGIEGGSEERARAVLESLFNNVASNADSVKMFQNDVQSIQDFYRNVWEKRPLFLKRANRTHFDGLLSKNDIEEFVKTKKMKYGEDINVTHCNSKGIRKTLDLSPGTVAKENDVWTNFEQGCSVRLLCPHSYSSTSHAFLSHLESEFGCMVGANAYLTPGNVSQGFAPHYDDIEAFVLQLEGSKRWRVYPPMNVEETLPRESSKDFDPKVLPPPVLDIVLEPGDLLYMPRGWIHQAVTTRDKTPSLHLTASVMQHWCWADFMELLIPEALQAVCESDENTSLREGLPRNFLSYMGAIHDSNPEYDEMLEGQNAGKGNIPSKEQKNTATNDFEVSEDDQMDGMDEEELERLQMQEMRKLQNKFKEEAKKRILQICDEAMTMVEVTCDQLGKRFLSERLPPAYIESEAIGTVERKKDKGGKILPSTMCRIARAGIARLVIEDDKAVLYHCAENTCKYQEVPLSPMEFELDDAPALEQLITVAEPCWICVRDIIHDDMQDKIGVAQALYEEGILSIFQPE